jgi:hypothetical protein
LTLPGGVGDNILLDPDWGDVMFGGDVFSLKPELKAITSAGGKIPEMEAAAAFLREGEIKKLPAGSQRLQLRLPAFPETKWRNSPGYL